MRYLSILTMFLFLGCCSQKDEPCLPHFFEHYQQNQLYGLIELFPDPLKFSDSVLCTYRVRFPFWENTGYPLNNTFILDGYFLMQDSTTVLYSKSNVISFRKIFDFSLDSRNLEGDTALIMLSLSNNSNGNKTILEGIEYHRAIKSYVFRYKILDVSLLTDHDNLTLLVSPKFGIIGSYVSFFNEGSVHKGKEFIISYIGDISPYYLMNKNSVFEKFNGYE